MKVFGPLEYAQMESLAADPANQPIGRTYLVTTDLAGKSPRIVTDRGVERVLTSGRDYSIYGTNQAAISGITVIDWNNGKSQKATLTGHSILSFINQKEGEEYRLIITQDPTVRYSLKLGMKDLYLNGTTPDVVLSNGESRFLHFRYSNIFTLTNTTWGYTNLTDPTLALAALAGSPTCCAVAPDGSAIVFGHGTTPFITAYKINPDGSFGQKYTVPSALPPAAVTGLAFNPTGDKLAWSSGTTPFVGVYQWSPLGFGGAFANAVTLPTGAANCVAFSPDCFSLAVGHATTPFCSAYTVLPSSIVKIANPVALPSFAVTAVTFSPLSDYIAVGYGTTPFMHVYSWLTPGGTSFPGWGSQITNPVTLPTGQVNAFSWHPGETYLCAVHATAPATSVYPFAAGVLGVKLTNPGSAVPGNGKTGGFSPQGDYIYVGSDSTGFLTIYDFTANSDLQTALNPPFVLPSAAVLGAAWGCTPGGDFIYQAISSSTAPNYYTAPRSQKNWVRLKE